MKYLFIALFIVPSMGFAKSLEEGQSIGSPNGRYVLGQISSFRRDQYLLDTKTGKVWTTSEVDGVGTIFQKVYFSCGSDSWDDSLSCSNPIKYIPKKKEETNPSQSSAQ